MLEKSQTLSTNTCWFCSGEIEPGHEVNLAVRLFDHVNKDSDATVVSFCSRNCRDTYRFGLDYRNHEEPGIVY
jgi:ribosomal protein L24E